METPGRKIYKPTVERGHWGSRVEFLLSCVGYSVGLGNVWRFPFLAYENGGGAFLIPYFILLVLVGKPMYFMEAALGQFGQVGPLQIWVEMLPAAVGVGVAMVIISMIVAIYYNVIMAYCLFYLFNSFTSVLPWTVCDPQWSDERCYVRGANTSSLRLEDQCVEDGIGGCKDLVPQTSEEQFWERKVLDIRSEGLGEFGDFGNVKMDLAFYLLMSWIVVLLCLAKGIKTSGKAIYFTATFPYLVMLVLLVVGLTLPGAEQGLYFLFVPKWEKLASFTVWRRAASQVFFSLGISWGGIIMFGSYNKFNAQVHVDAHIVSVIDFLTSILASVVIFSTLGHSAHKLGVDVESVAKGGQGLAFVAYPEALSHLPVPQVWSAIFFLMLFLLGLDSEFALFETVLCAIFDTFPRLRSVKLVVTSLMCMVCFLLGLPCITQTGQYVLNLMDTYGASLSVLVIAVAEMVALMWGYGFDNFSLDIKAMLGFTPGWYFKVCWVVISPLLLVAIFIASCADWQQPSYGSTPYPTWAHAIGWALTLVSVIQIPFWMFIMMMVSLMSGRLGFWSIFYPSDSWVERRYDIGDNTFIEKPDSTLAPNSHFLDNSTNTCYSSVSNTTSLHLPPDKMGRPGMDCSTIRGHPEAKADQVKIQVFTPSPQPCKYFYEDQEF